MDFVTGAFASWLIEQLADAGRRRLVSFLFGGEQQRALRGAADAAILATAADFYPQDEQRAVELASVIDQVFGSAITFGPTSDNPTLLQGLHAGIGNRLAPLGDADLTDTGSSSADRLGVSVTMLGQRLTKHLVREIQFRGAYGGPLEPLAGQLNDDLTHLQGTRIERKLDELTGAVDDFLTGLSSWLPAISDSQRFIVQSRRQEASAWCDKVLSGNSVDFWQSDWRHVLGGILDNPQSLVLTARGGSGKSVLAAHIVRHLLQQDPANCLVVLTSSEQLGELNSVRRLIGVESAEELTRYVDTMRILGHRVLFIIDGLDSIIGSASTRAAGQILEELADTSCLLVTCRTELWDQEFSHLSLRSQRLDPLTADTVRRVLLAHTPFKQWSLPVLRIPFYLDAALTLSRHVIELPKTETGLLQALWNTYREPPGAALPRWYSFEPLLTGLAEMQLTNMTYEVPRSVLMSALQNISSAAEALPQLEGGGVIWRQGTAVGVTIRLNHDLLDCFNIARLLIVGDEARHRRQLVYERIADGVGWSVLSMLVQVAYDGSKESVLTEVFVELIGILDRKRWDDRWMARSWAATYVLRDKLTELLPLMLDCLDGEQVPSLEQSAVRGGSTLGPRPHVTQETASSLASSFEALDDWRAGHPERAIPVLRRGLERWQLRKRFVEALAKYNDPAALEALTIFARKELSQGGDTSLLGEVAEALGRIGLAFTGENRQACIAIISNIIANPGLESRIRRTAIESKNRLTYPDGEPVPEVDEAEIIANLSPFDGGRGSYSDWRVIQRYSDYAYARIMNGHLSRPLLDALLHAFTHEQLYARISIANCLGQADDPAARSVLLSELLRPSLSWDVQQACLQALGVQIRNSSGPTERTLRRWLVLDAAYQATRSSTPAAMALAELAAKSWDVSDYLLTHTAFELLPVSTVPGKMPAQFIHVLPSTAAPVADWIQGLVLQEDYAAAGSGWEVKYRMASISSPDDTQPQVSIAETTWEEGASFHRAMRREQSSTEFRFTVDRLMSAWIEGAAVPGIFSVHCIVTTRDGKVVETLRPTGTMYSPGLWSISFEEQVTSADLDPGPHDAATAAALRGFTEEFGLPADGCRARVVSAIVELPILNPVLVVVIEADVTSSDFRLAFDALQGTPDKELDEISFAEVSPGSLASEIERPDLHPTSAIRAMILSRNLR